MWEKICKVPDMGVNYKASPEQFLRIQQSQVPMLLQVYHLTWKSKWLVVYDAL